MDAVRIPLVGGFGQRRSWLWFAGVLVMTAVAFLGAADPETALPVVAAAAIVVGVAGVTFDIVIDAYRIELLEPRQPGAGSGMSQYGWRIGAASAGAVALVVAARYGWAIAYDVWALFALPAMVTGLVIGEPVRRRAPAPPTGIVQAAVAYFSPLTELLQRTYALLSALASIAGRFLTGTTAGALIDALGYVNFYLLTTLIAAPGVLLYWYMIRSGLADVSLGSAGKDEPAQSGRPRAS